LEQCVEELHGVDQTSFHDAQSTIIPSSNGYAKLIDPNEVIELISKSAARQIPAMERERE